MHPDPETPERRFICPYCGGPTPAGARCGVCQGPLDPLSRQATQNDMGPWFIRDPGSPFRPGFSARTLRTLVARGRIRPDTVLRGPTTRQFWMPARRAPGVSALLGVCHNCQGPASEHEPRCPACDADLTLPEDRQVLGLGAIVPVPGQADADWESRSGPQAPAEAFGVASGPPAHAGEDPNDVGALATIARLRRTTRTLRAWLILSLVAAAALAGVAVLAAF